MKEFLKLIPGAIILMVIMFVIAAFIDFLFFKTFTPEPEPVEPEPINYEATCEDAMVYRNAEDYHVDQAGVCWLEYYGEWSKVDDSVWETMLNGNYEYAP